MNETAEKYYELDAQIAQITTTLKTLKEQKEILAETLLKIMINQKVESLRVKDKVVCVKIQTTPESLNQQYLQDTLSTYFSKVKNPVPEATVEHIMENRAKTEKKILKMLKAKN
jgi:hypothetical protein